MLMAKPPARSRTLQVKAINVDLCFYSAKTDSIDGLVRLNVCLSETMHQICQLSPQRFNKCKNMFHNTICKPAH